jgi:hypothetical protein
MENFWLNKIDKALRALGYLPDIIAMFDKPEKEALLIDEYLFILQQDREDCLPLSLDDMADFIIDYKRGKDATI